MLSQSWNVVRMTTWNMPVRRRLPGTEAPLGGYLKPVSRGQAFIVTDRSQPVAELRPLGPPLSPADARLAAMAALGAITLPSSARLTPLAPVSTGRQLGSDAIRRDREERF